MPQPFSHATILCSVSNPSAMPQSCVHCLNPSAMPQSFVQYLNPSAMPQSCVLCLNPSAMPQSCVQYLNPSAMPQSCVHCLNPSAMPQSSVQCLKHSAMPQSSVQCLKHSAITQSYVQCLNNSDMPHLNPVFSVWTCQPCYLSQQQHTNIPLLPEGKKLRQETMTIIWQWQHDGSTCLGSVSRIPSNNCCVSCWSLEMSAFSWRPNTCTPTHLMLICYHDSNSTILATAHCCPSTGLIRYTVKYPPEYSDLSGSTHTTYSTC